MCALDLIPAPIARGGTLPRTVPRSVYFRGALLGVGIGDALGRPAESKPPSWIEGRYGSLRDYHPWGGYGAGSITDDTQMTLCIAHSIIEKHRVDPDDIAARFVEWLPHGRGKGRTCIEAVKALRSGKDWMTSGVGSAGNGGAMRVVPIGLLHATNPDALRRDAAISSIITHADPMAVVSAVAQAFAVAYLLHTEPGHLDLVDFHRSVQNSIADLHDPGMIERRGDAGPDPVRLADRLGELVAMRDMSPADAFARLHNGAFVLESLPAAWWAFLRSPEEPEQIIITAADGGYDADTVASLAGALAGAYHGAEAFPDRWVQSLEVREELMRAADGIHELVSVGHPQPLVLDEPGTAPSADHRTIHDRRESPCRPFT